LSRARDWRTKALVSSEEARDQVGEFPEVLSGDGEGEVEHVADATEAQRSEKTD